MSYLHIFHGNAVSWIMWIFTVSIGCSDRQIPALNIPLDKSGWLSLAITSGC